MRSEILIKNEGYRLELFKFGRGQYGLNFTDRFTGETIGGIEFDSSQLPRLPGKSLTYRRITLFLRSMESGGLAYLMTSDEKEKALDLISA